jgi:CBS domain-containing protein
VDIKDIMIEKVVCVDSSATVRDAACLMNLHGIGCFVVTNNSIVAGIVTERDILKRVVAQSRDANETKVSEVMSKPIIKGGPDMYVEDATKLMLSKNIKKLPIMKHDKIIGIVTFSDIARTANIEPRIAKAVEELKKDGWLPSQKMEKVVDFYVA